MPGRQRQTYSRSSQRLTPHLRERAAAAAAIVRNHVVNHGFSPTLDEVGAALHVTAGAAYRYLAFAESMGLVQHTEDAHRNWLPADTDQTMCPACGQFVQRRREPVVA